MWDKFSHASMTPVVAFRLLIVLEVVFTISGPVAHYFMSDFLPVALQEYLSEADEGIFSGLDTEAASFWVFCGSTILIWLAVSVALFVAGRAKQEGLCS